MSLASWKRRLRPRPLIQQLEIRDLAARALVFEARLRQLRSQLPTPDPGWYPWDSFGNLSMLDRLLTGRHRYLQPLIGDLPMLDLGAGDGDLAFFFESLGCRVCAIDNPPTNYNRMAGIEALKRASIPPSASNRSISMAPSICRCATAGSPSAWAFSITSRTPTASSKPSPATPIIAC